MKKFLLTLLLGLVIGGGVAWLMLRHPATPAADAVPATADQPANSTAGIKLSKDELVNAGLQTAAPEPFSWRAEVKGYARVLDPAPLAALYTEIAADQAALDASTKEYDRQKLLRDADNASARTLETAEAAKIRDETTLESAQARLLSGWGQALMDQSDPSSFIRSLLKLQSALVRVDVPSAEALPTPPLHLRLTPILGEEISRDAAVLGPAPVADAQMQGPGFLALLDAPVPPPGTTLLAWIHGEEPAKDGLRLPTSAIVYDTGNPYVYLQTGTDEKTGEITFARRPVVLGAPLREGVFVISGLTPQDKVVVLGTQQLLAEEQKAAGGGDSGD